MTKFQNFKNPKKPNKSSVPSPKEERPKSEKECSSDPNDWHPKHGPHPSD